MNPYWISLRRGFISQLQHERASILWGLHAFVEPVFVAFVVIMLYQFTGTSPQDYTTYVIFGSGFLGVWAMVLSFGGKSIFQERTQGTLELMFLTPVSLFTFSFGKILSSAATGLVSVAAVLFVGKFVLRLPIHIESPGLFLVSVVMTILTLSVFGLILASFYMLTRRVAYFMNLMQYMIYVLVGLLFPISVLPSWVRPISYSLSLTWALDAIRVSVSENAWESLVFWTDVTMVVLLTAGYLLVAVLLYRYVRKMAVRDGKLSVY